MAPTLVNAAFGALLAAALLGAAFDRRSVAVVVAAAALPDLDAVASLALDGATNALLHNVWIPLGVAALLYWDTTVRGESRIRAAYGWRGVRIAWVSLAAFAVAGIGPELFGLGGVNLLYPVHDAYYLVAGRLIVSTQDGIVQTFVAAGSPGMLPLESPGTTASYAIPTWINPDGRPGLALGATRELHVVRTGWQAVVVAAAATLLAVRFLEPADGGDT
ncbi:ABC-type multidrug transport system fused ATPase/permease subunit [Halorubrum alkaliphilum]|uniref:ABC-type multidrug transport system fused ATPase/permease subunit n=1 Tax=Halorubrum alkaliphilum TaxID=261290 RepID=A0A8T4GGK0_9EURY|nr:hypothetical protein [Halorubrum alkaliphilum]MBP1922770.1 ABC-type multidrug transport system fused ATPase/permease subunit [Halorubrum alkaliphilum]